MNIGEKIRQRRKEIGMTQEELAEKAGYKSKSSINKIEKGISEINQTQLSVIAKSLYVTPAYFIDDTPVGDYCLDDDSKTLVEFLKNNPDYKTLFDAVRNVPESDLQIVKALIDKFRTD